MRIYCDWPNDGTRLMLSSGGVLHVWDSDAEAWLPIPPLMQEAGG